MRTNATLLRIDAPLPAQPGREVTYRQGKPVDVQICQSDLSFKQTQTAEQLSVVNGSSLLVPTSAVGAWATNWRALVKHEAESAPRLWRVASVKIVRAAGMVYCNELIVEEVKP